MEFNYGSLNFAIIKLIFIINWIGHKRNIKIINKPPSFRPRKNHRTFADNKSGGAGLPHLITQSISEITSYNDDTFVAIFLKNFSIPKIAAWRTPKFCCEALFVCYYATSSMRAFLGDVPNFSLYILEK